MIELETLNWRIDGSGPKRLLGKCTLEFGLRARLVRLTDGTVLWRCFCQSAHPRQCNDLFADDLKLVRSLRAELATRCAAELVGAFMGRRRGQEVTSADRRRSNPPAPAASR